MLISVGDERETKISSAKEIKRREQKDLKGNQKDVIFWRSREEMMPGEGSDLLYQMVLRAHVKMTTKK